MSGTVEQLRAFGVPRLAILAGVGIATLGLILWLALRAAEPPMGLLYGDLDARDAGQIVAALERARVPHRITQGGTQILAPEAQVPRLRLQLARDGLPQGGSVGNEIFDRGESLTTTPFQQDMNRVRALEGELARTIRGLAGVRGARVHLVLQRREPFSRERGEAQASVVLTMLGAQRLDREGVQAVLHLVATAVPGLRAQNVSIVDSRGALLARGGQALAGPAAAQTQEELRRTQELRISRGLEEMLERTVGPGRVRVEATVEMDFDRVQTTEERFDPENQVARSQTSVQEQTRNSEGGAVTVQNNLPGAEPAAAGAGGQESRQEETTNFEIGRTTRNTLREHPVLRRQSVAVLVDGIWDPVEGAAPRFRERNAEELARIQALVRSAVGFDERRGDRVEIVSLRFAEPPEPEAPPAGLFGISALAISGNTTARLIESAMFAVVALLGLLLVVRPVAGRLITAVTPPRTALAAPVAPGAAIASATGATAITGAAAPGMVAIGQSAATPEQAGAAELISVQNIEGQLRASSIARLHDLVERHPDESLNVVRRWLVPEER